MTDTPRAARATSRRLRLTLVAALGLLLSSAVLTACGPDARQAAAEQNKAQLDHELTHARHDLGIPEAMLSAVETQEQKVAAGAGGWTYNYGDAAANYTLLYSQLLGIEQTSADTLRKQTQADVQAFTTALNERRGQGFAAANTYQARLDQALKQYDQAKIPGDYVQVDTLVRAQTEALRALWPAYQKLQDLKSVVHALSTAGINTSQAEQQYQQDLQAFGDAGTAERYVALGTVIDGQVMQLIADQNEAMPFIGSTLLGSFQARIDQLAQDGEKTDQFQQQHDDDAKQLAAATQLADYLTLGQAINKQINAMTLPLVRGQARHNLKVLEALVSYAQGITRPSHYDGTTYTVAYEYASPDEGIGGVQQEVAGASTVDDFQNANDDVGVMTSNLRALLDNLRDSTPHSQPHAADLTLMQHYGITQGRVVVVSLYEQTARLYDNGKLVYWSYVTTGRPELPSPPGLHYAMEKLYHTTFQSAEPKGSPFWYAPTPINYAILYANYGFFMHDGWWRSEFGPDTNLPHFDPAAFNGGSHGCINFPLDNMAYVYDWTPIGTPIVIY